MDYVWDQFDFNFFDALGVTSISVSASSSRGGVPVLIFGGGFDESRSLSCRFGIVEASIRLLNSSCLECITPQMQPGRSNLSIISLSSSVLVGVYSFDFHQDAILISISPTVVTAGSSDVISIFGKSFLRTHSFVCLFGVYSIRGNVSSAESATCQFPALSSGSVTLSISNDGTIFSEFNAAITIKDCSTDHNCSIERLNVMSGCVPGTFCQENLIVTSDFGIGSAGLMLDLPTWNGESWTLSVGALFSKPPRTLSSLSISASALTSVFAFDTAAHSGLPLSLQCSVGNNEVSVDSPSVPIGCKILDYQQRSQTMPVIVNISIQDALSRNQYVLCATDPFVGITLNCVVDLKSFWFEKS